MKREDYDFIAEVESDGNFAIEFEGIIIVDGKEYIGKCVLNESAIIYGKGITKFRFIGVNIKKIHLEKNDKQTDGIEMFTNLINMNVFTADRETFSKVINLRYAWSGCINLKEFPYIDSSEVIDAGYAWYMCKSLTDFPLIGLGNVIDIYSSWSGCIRLRAFPTLDLDNVEVGDYTWYECKALVKQPIIKSNTDLC